jgi:hypothetical protein
VSVGVAGLNVGLGARMIPRPWRKPRAAHAVAPGARLVTVYQVHSAIVWWRRMGRCHRPMPMLWSRPPGVVLGI